MKHVTPEDGLQLIAKRRSYLAAFYFSWVLGDLERRSRKKNLCINKRWTYGLLVIIGIISLGKWIVQHWTFLRFSCRGAGPCCLDCFWQERLEQMILEVASYLWFSDPVIQIGSSLEAQITDLISKGQAKILLKLITKLWDLFPKEDNNNNRKLTMRD